jgi:hypothetical protein
MRKNQVNGILNDLIKLNSWNSPANSMWIPKKYEINLITGKVKPIIGNDISEYLDYKSKWFKERIRELDGDLKDFQKAAITLFGAREKAVLIYKGEEFKKDKSIIKKGASYFEKYS